MKLLSTLAKRIGETTKSLGKTSKELGKEMQQLGDDAEKGVRQFLDVGTGLPTADNTHESVGEAYYVLAGSGTVRSPEAYKRKRSRPSLVNISIASKNGRLATW